MRERGQEEEKSAAEACGALLKNDVSLQQDWTEPFGMSGFYYLLQLLINCLC